MTDDRFIVIAATGEPGWYVRDTFHGRTVAGPFDSLLDAAERADRSNRAAAA